jgi:hypothetical protein
MRVGLMGWMRGRFTGSVFLMHYCGANKRSYCRAARMRAWMTARVPTNLRFCVCVSMHQSGHSIERSVISSVKITNAAHHPQIESSAGLGSVDLLTDQRSECPHSGHCHMGMVWGCIVRKGTVRFRRTVDLNLSEFKAVTVPIERSMYRSMGSGVKRRNQRRHYVL